MAGFDDDVGWELDSPQTGPKPTTSLQRRHSPLASGQYQQQVLADLGLSQLPYQADFGSTLAAQGWPQLTPAQLEIFQINVGKLCNMTCHHCHVDAGPDRTQEVMNRETIDLCLQALDRTEAHTVDITGGAPELNPHFRYLVDECVRRGKHVIDRCNLTVLLLPGKTDLPQWLAERGVEIVCSLPHYRRPNTDAQRGIGAFEQSITVLNQLNAIGYGSGDPKRQLTLMSNPAGAFLASQQPKLEQEWREGLHRHHGISFDRLITLNNMPISRYLEWLEQSGNLQEYMTLLVNAFNPATIRGLMCRNTISVSWDGYLYDCDFNQMLDLPVQPTMHIREFDPLQLTQRQIVTQRHCFGCTAGAGSSCGGALAP
jgi:radical SAM/Cys-rich protein